MSKVPLQVLIARDNNDVVALKMMARKAARTRATNRDKAKAQRLQHEETQVAFASRQAEKEEQLLPWVVRHDDLLPEDQL